jgi:hypothetical protein
MLVNAIGLLMNVSTVATGIPALIAGDREDVFRGGRGCLVGDGRGDRRGSVGNRAEGAVVGLQAVMLMHRDQANRAQQIEHERAAEPRIESS